MSSPEDKLKALLISSAEMQTDSFIEGTIPIDHFRHWFLQQFTEETKGDVSCKLDNFAIYFLNTMRQRTENYLRSNENDQVLQTSKRATTSIAYCDTDSYDKNFKISTPKRHQIYAQNSAPSTPEQGIKPIENFENTLPENLSASFRCTPKNNSFLNSTPTQPVDRSLGNTFKSDSSTPIRRNQNSNRRSANSSLQTTTPHSEEKLVRNNSASSSFCLGDFIVLQQNNNRSNRKKTSHTQIQNTANVTSSESASNSKPKKRVVPTTISNRVAPSGVNDLKPFGCNSSFSNENNILQLTNAEIEDKNKCSIMAARKSLKLNANEISKELETVCIGNDEKNLRGMIERKLRDVTSSKIENEETEASISKQLPTVELDKIKNQSSIQHLADIYVVLMDLNFVTNVLSEMAFILNLLNAQEGTVEEPLQIDSSKPSSNVELDGIGINILNSATSCVYFALCVLKRQRYLFAHLDVKSLGVVLHNERVHCLDMDLKSYLDSIYQHKQTLLLVKSNTVEISAPIERSFKRVYYQEDKDSRQHFTSNNEFGAFKTQRDLFYKVLKLWETHHLNPNWNFANELSPKIREIFKQSENPINMAHFAKLFVSQLLISASDAASPEDIGLDVDAEKFSKLAQRFVAPSNFSVDYQFPRNQAFFRDFITEARSLPFVEQLKMALYSQLITLNNSTFEQLNLLTDNREPDEFETETVKDETCEFIVRPEVLASMIILAKFLGFITAYPYCQNLHSSVMSGIVEKKQLTLRSLFQPHFSASLHLLDAIKSNKMLITLPWLIQYLAMLDNVTLQLEDFDKTSYILFALYSQIGFNSPATCLTPSSIFILRCCLGWLFDTKSIMAEKYFRFIASQSPGNENKNNEKFLEFEQLTTGILRGPDCRYANDNKIEKNVNAKTPLNPILEFLLPVACPFLAEFRVAIMPSKYATTKYVSRTGRYRHITTRIAEPAQTPSNNSPTHSGHNVNSNALSSQQTLQNKLIDAFLHSQNASMRRLIEFVTERIYKSIVKDGQHKYILPSKAAADKRVNEITSSNTEEVLKKVSAIYETAHKDARRQWETNLSKLIDERIKTALNALLPTDTTPVVKRTYSQLIRQNAMKRIQQWFQDNLERSNLYCGDLNEITQKICKANKKDQQTLASLSELQIVQLEPSVSDLLDELQYWLHCTSIRVDELLTTGTDSIISFLQRIPRAFVNKLPIFFYRLIGAGVVQLTQHLIIHKPECLTSELMKSACAVWLHPKFQVVVESFDRNRKGNDKSSAHGSDDDSPTKIQRTPSIYDGLITVAFVEALAGNINLFGKLKDLLVYMIRKQVLTTENVNVLFVPIFKENWSANVLNEISKTLQRIADETVQIRRTESDVSAKNGESSDDEAKSHLFMEVLADLTRDVENLGFY